MFGTKNISLLWLLQVLVVILVCGVIEHGESYRLGDNPYRRAAILGPQERYRIEWIVDRDLARISFNVTVQTTGWVLFGFANDDGKRTGRDVVIGGVRKNGKAYFSDRHTGRFNERLQVDHRQDYTLDTSWENGPYTFLSFSRDLDTCDSQDYPITENKVTLVWAYGDQDDVDGVIYVHKGTYDVYLLDAEHAPRIYRQNLFDNRPRLSGRESTSFQYWTISTTAKISKETSYICSIHKAPQLHKKHHVIGFDVTFPDDQSRNHTHHLIVRRCHAPRGSSARQLFDRFARNGQQQSCFWPPSPAVGEIPLHFCTQIYMVWGAGGREYFTPDNVGFPFGMDSEEYYMFQAHYDNPTRSAASVTINVDFFYTRRLRSHDGGIFGFGAGLSEFPESILIPPQTKNMRVFGHCSGECTRRIFPQEGITVVGGILHGHSSSRQMRLHHFRNNEELPWLLYDDNYSDRFQQFRAVRKGEVQIYPGDQVTMDCMYDNTWTNGTVTGGFRTKSEMCFGWVVYYNLIPDYIFCGSDLVSPAYRKRFLGVTNVTWYESQLDWVAELPSTKFLVGRTISDISDNWIDWDEDARKELQEFNEQHPHVGSCGRLLHTRNPEDIQAFLEGASQTGEAVINAEDVPINVNTENYFSGHVKYPFSSIAYSIAPDYCSQKGLFQTQK